MTAEERRERKISDIYANSPNWKPSRFIQARMRDAYEAGRSAGLEEASIAMDDQGCPECSAAIRALITAPQKG